jgi:hypothetical protein
MAIESKRSVADNVSTQYTNNVTLQKMDHKRREGEEG